MIHENNQYQPNKGHWKFLLTVYKKGQHLSQNDLCQGYKYFLKHKIATDIFFADLTSKKVCLDPDILLTFSACSN